MSIEQFFYKGSTEPKLDFADVLLVPSLHLGGSTEVKSRADVTLQVDYSFPNTETRYTGIPVIAANMDNIGTFRVHGVFQQNKMCVAITKNTPLDTWKMNFGHGLTVNDNTAMVSIGMADDELDLLEAVTKYTPVKFICMDIANGYLPQFARQVSKIRKLYPNKIIVAGNVVTPDAVVELYRAGADCVKLGIGPGSACFPAGTLVRTNCGNVPIEEIKAGDQVLTHRNRYRAVVNTFKNSDSRRISVNGVTCTPDHKFYVVDKSQATFVNESNLCSYAKWVKAKDIDPEIHLIVSMDS